MIPRSRLPFSSKAAELASIEKWGGPIRPSKLQQTSKQWLQQIICYYWSSIPSDQEQDLVTLNFCLLQLKVNRNLYILKFVLTLGLQLARTNRPNFFKKLTAIQLFMIQPLSISNITDNCLFFSEAISNKLFFIFRIDWKPTGDPFFLIRPKKNPVILIMVFELGENSKMYTWKFSFHYILPPWRDESSFWRKIGNFEKLIKFIIVGKKDHKCNSCSCEPH